MGRLGSAYNALFPTDAKRAVSAKWLLSRSSLIDKQFVSSARVQVEHQGSYDVVNVNGHIYTWPSDAETSALLTILSELQNPNHPHHYLYGQTQIHKNDVVIDIGACEGSFSACAAELGAKVVAVEPSQVMTDVINKLFQIRQLEKPTIANVLLGQRVGELYFIDNQHNPGASRVVERPEDQSYAVPVTTLDGMVSDLGLDKVDFIKCDAEGADVEILKSGRKTLERFHPKIAVTTYHNSTDYDELFDYLKSLGYNLRGKGLLYSANRYRVLMLHAW